jgi:MOSC domain-containing protein YiiM
VKLRSVNVGRPRPVEWNGTVVMTSIWKHAVDGPVRATPTNLAGDEQSDLSVHGGPDKAVYAYPSEHYASWSDELRVVDLPWGAFGENLTTEGLVETDVRIGDRLRIGTAEFVVTQPRLPCFKLALRLDRPDIIQRFVRRNQPGFYLAVAREGVVQAGDGIEVVGADPTGVTVAEVAALRNGLVDDDVLMRRAVRASGLSEGWRAHFRTRLGARGVPTL